MAIKANFFAPSDEWNIIENNGLRIRSESALIFANKMCQKTPADHLCNFGLANKLDIR